MEISVILCTFNRGERLRSVLTELANLTIPADLTHEIVVVDNNSTDETQSIVQEFCSKYPGRFRSVFEPTQGKSFSLNTGIRHATGKILAFTDDDVSLDPEWLVEIRRAFEDYQCLAVAGRIVAVWDSERPWWHETEGPYKLLPADVRFDLGEQAKEIKVPAWGANMAVRREAFEEFGLFREDLGLNPQSLMRSRDLGAWRFLVRFDRHVRSLIGGEDVEMWDRMIAGGAKLVYAPAILVRHPVEADRATQSYYLTWYFGHGRTTARLHGIGKGAPHFLGVPRWLFRQLIEGVARWALCPNRKRRFYYKLRVYADVGQFVEHRAIARRRSD